MKLLKKYREIIMYIVFGAATTIVNWSVYTVCIKFIHIGMTLSNMLAWIIAVVFAFVTNKIFVFQSTNTTFKTLSKELFSFISARMITGIIEVFMPTVLWKLGLNGILFGIKGFWSKAVVSVAVIVLNYIFSKLVVFKNK